MLTRLLDRTLLPTDDDVAFYNQHGWWVSPVILDDELLDAAVEGSERFYRGELDPGPEILPEFVPAPPYGDDLRKHDYASLRCAALGAIVRHPNIGATAARLSGASVIRLWHDQLILKPPERDRAAATRIGWHTDRHYWRACTSSRMLTAWVPFQDVDEEMGTLMVADGSHRWSDGVAHEGLSDAFAQDLDTTEAAIGRRRSLEKVPLVLKRGQVSFHSASTFHASGPNRKDVPRRSISIHMQDGENRFSGARLPDGSLVRHNNDALVRTRDGAPDYSDERYCPVLSVSGP